MLYRAVLVLAIPFAVLALGLAVWDAHAGGESPLSSISGGLLFLVGVPFIAPLLLRRAALWVVGSRPPADTVRGASPRRPPTSVSEWPL